MQVAIIITLRVHDKSTQKLDFAATQRGLRDHFRSVTRLASALATGEPFARFSVHMLVAGISRFRSQNPLGNKKAKLR